MKLQINADKRREAGKSPSLLVMLLPLTAPDFASPGFGKMPKARAEQKVRKKSRIKR